MTKDDLYRLLTDAVPLAGWTEAPGGEAVLTSLDVIVIIARLYDQYGIRIPSNEIKKENFRSVETLWELCQKMKERG